MVFVCCNEHGQVGRGTGGVARGYSEEVWTVMVREEFDKSEGGGWETPNKAFFPFLVVS